MGRPDGRLPGQLRPVRLTRGYTKYAEGSVLIEVGDTRVLCTASIDEKVPAFLRGSGRGWVTAEYSLLPRSTQVRTPREAARGRQGGRTHEIQRLIGRSLRAVVDLERLGERCIVLDCDVLQADGGTRTASVTGAFVALVDALEVLRRQAGTETLPVTDFLAAVSVGLAGGEPRLDLCFEEDSQAEVDMNVVMTGAGKLVEVQATAEGNPFSRSELGELLDLARRGSERLVEAQKEALGPDLTARIGRISPRPAAVLAGGEEGAP